MVPQVCTHCVSKGEFVQVRLQGDRAVRNTELNNHMGNEELKENNLE